MLRRNENPGKFEGGLVIDEFVYALSPDEERGDVDRAYWFGLLRGPISVEDDVTPEEASFLAGIAGAIVCENSDGSVGVHYYSDSGQLEETWDQIEDDC